MEINAMKIENVQPVLEYGMVAGVSDRAFHVMTDSGIFESLPSFSCLIAPEAGDRVLLSIDETGVSYILSVLERPYPGTTKLNLAGDVALNVRGGRLSMTSDEAISLASGILEISASEGTIRMEKASFFGTIVENHIEKLKLVVDSMQSTVRRAVERLTSSFRYVEEHEEIQSASTRMIVDGTLTMHTKNTMHIAEGHVKIDAGQIHLG
jgi:hypothetical protein